MRRCIDLLWGGVGSAGISWIGFYEREGDDQMTLVCREPKPACSPIGLHGMCGRGMLDRRPLVIADVRTLGPNYIACDPKDQSELVIPLLAPDGSCDAVLDVDSWDLASFDDRDAAGMKTILGVIGTIVLLRVLQGRSEQLTKIRLNGMPTSSGGFLASRGSRQQQLKGVEEASI